MVRRFLRDKLHIVGKAFLMALVLMMANGITVNAFEPVELRVPVKQILKLIDSESFPESGSTVTYRLTATGDKKGPLPEGASESYEFEIKGDTTLKLPAMRFTGVGIFKYQLSRVAPESKNRITYDDEVYDLTVQVTRRQVEGKWVLNLEWVAKNEDGVKPDEVFYEHTYQGVKSPDDEKPDDEKPDKDTPDKTPDKDSTTGGGKAPKTGDESNSLFYLVMMGAAAVILGIVFYKKKKEKDSPE